MLAGMRRGFVPWLCCVGVGVAALICSPLLWKAYQDRPSQIISGGTFGDGTSGSIVVQPENHTLLLAFYAVLTVGAVSTIIGVIGIIIELKGGAPYANVARGFDVTRRGGE